MVDSLLGPDSGGSGGRSTRPRRLSNRLVRTILLGSVAVAVAIFWLARSYGVELEALFDYLLASLAFVGVFALAGILCGLGIRLIRHFGRR